MRRVVVRTCVLAVAGLLWANVASASPIPIGEASTVPIGSWILTNVIESSALPFDKIEAFITSGNSTFEDSGWGALDYGGATGWTSTRINPTYAVATGGSLVTQQWLSNKFTSGSGTMVVWDILVWSGSTQVDAFRMWSNGDGWSQYNTTAFNTSGGWDLNITGTYDRSVPDGGATLALLGCALVGLGALRRKFGV